MRLRLPPHSIIEYVGATALASTTPAQWRASGLTGALAVLPRPGTLLYNPATTLEDVREPVRACRAALGPQARLLLAFWCGNELPGVPLEQSHLFPWDDDDGWQLVARNLRYLSRACAESRVLGVLMDAEHYGANVDDSGQALGYQNPRIAWPAGDPALIGRRARQYARAIRSRAPGLRLGHYLGWASARGLLGLVPWLRALRRYAGGSLLTGVEDTYTRLDADARAAVRTLAEIAGPDVLAGYAWRTAELEGGAYTAGIAARREFTPAGVWTIWDGREQDPGQQHEPFGAGLLERLARAHGEA